MRTRPVGLAGAAETVATQPTPFTFTVHALVARVADSANLVAYRVWAALNVAAVSALRANRPYAANGAKENELLGAYQSVLEVWHPHTVGLVTLRRWRRGPVDRAITVQLLRPIATPGGTKPAFTTFTRLFIIAADVQAFVRGSVAGAITLRCRATSNQRSQFIYRGEMPTGACQGRLFTVCNRLTPGHLVVGWWVLPRQARGGVRPCLHKLLAHAMAVNTDCVVAAGPA